MDGGKKMKRILILVSLGLFLGSAASAFQGGGGESTKKNAVKKKTSVTKASNPKPTGSAASPTPRRKPTQTSGRSAVRATAELTIRSAPPNSLILIDGESVG